MPGVGVPFGFGATFMLFGLMPGAEFAFVIIGLLENSGGKLAWLVLVVSEVEQAKFIAASTTIKIKKAIFDIKNIKPRICII